MYIWVGRGNLTIQWYTTSTAKRTLPSALDGANDSLHSKLLNHVLANRLSRSLRKRQTMLHTRQLSTDESRSAFDVVLEVVNDRFGLLLGGGAGEDEEENVGVLLKVILDSEEDSWRYGKGSEG